MQPKNFWFSYTRCFFLQHISLGLHRVYKSYRIMFKPSKGLVNLSIPLCSSQTKNSQEQSEGLIFDIMYILSKIYGLKEGACILFFLSQSQSQNQKANIADTKSVLKTLISIQVVLQLALVHIHSQAGRQTVDRQSVESIQCFQQSSQHALVSLLQARETKQPAHSPTPKLCIPSTQIL